MVTTRSQAAPVAKTNDAGAESSESTGDTIVVAEQVRRKTAIVQKKAITSKAIADPEVPSPDPSIETGNSADRFLARVYPEIHTASQPNGLTEDVRDDIKDFILIARVTAQYIDLDEARRQYVQRCLEVAASRDTIVREYARSIRDMMTIMDNLKRSE